MFLSTIQSYKIRAVRTLTMIATKGKVAVCQMTATNDKAHNLNLVKKLVANAKEQNSEVIFFPEACDYIAQSSKEAIHLAEPLTGDLVAEYKKLAKFHNVWLSFGGIHELTENNKAYNCHIVINNLGDIVSSYRKLHLFDVNIPEDKVLLMESNTIEPGHNVTPPLDTPIGKLGLSICYDMRFPELNIALRQRGAEILTYPSAFTYATGAVHWQTLLQARAIESQCYVIAAAQVGAHNHKRMSYGQAMIVDPWGKILAECEIHDGSQKSYDPTFCTATIDLEKLLNVRKKMPVIEHRRADIYGNIRDRTAFKPKQVTCYKFSDKDISASTVFLSTSLSYAFTNLRCVVPGHVLVAPIRNVEKLKDLTVEETADLFNTTIKVQNIVEQAYKATSSTIAVQDGKDAGQTVKHVHVHVLPRVLNDFEENDQIYEKLANHDRDMKPPRTTEEMEKEAEMLRQLFCKP